MSMQTAISPGDLVRLDAERVSKKLKEDNVTLWRKTPAQTLEQLHEGGNTEHCGRAFANEVGMVIARISGLNGVPGTDSDQILVLFGSRLGWNSVHWFQKIQNGG